MLEMILSQRKPTSRILIKRTHFFTTAKPNKQASTFQFKLKWLCNTTAGNWNVLYSGNIRFAPFCWKYQLSDVDGRKEDRRFVCLCWMGLDMLPWALSNHLLDSISSSVTSADHIPSKPTTWRQKGAIMVREWQLPKV